ncbi:hypothetical protein [Burkholderia ubonensis]|nr:hypothetical protein [Burkholderia ubonensis]
MTFKEKAAVDRNYFDFESTMKAGPVPAPGARAHKKASETGGP